VLAFWVALPIAILILFAMIAGDWDKSRPRMALPADGGYPVYPRPQTTDRGAVAAMVVLSVLIILACWFLWRRGLPIAVLSGVFIVFVQFVQRDRSGVDQNSAVAAVAKLFQVCGYRVDLHPQVGDPELDALLEPMDLFAAGGTGSFAVSVCTTQRGRQSVHWKLAASVRAAGTLYAGKDEVQALLLLVGVPLKNDLRAFARGEGIRVIPLPDGAIIYRVMRTEDPDELRQIAEIYLQIEPQRVEAQA
jgi:hypothetical protein